MKKYLTILVLFTLFSSCGKDCTDSSNPECPNYNPCSNKMPTNANFKTMVYCGDTLVEVDFSSGGRGSMWYFVADDTNADEYLWEVGQDKFYTKSFQMQGFPNEEYVPIKLTVKRKNPNTKCFPNDNGVATLTKEIYSEIWDNFQYNYIDSTPPKNQTLKTVNGAYRGYKKSKPNEFFEVTFKNYSYAEFTDMPTIDNNLVKKLILPGVDIVNLPYYGKGLISTFFNPLSISFQSKYLPNHYSSASPQAVYFNCYTLYSYAYQSPFAKYYSYFYVKAFLAPKNKDQITIIYEFFNPETEKIEKDVFIGNRI